MKVDMQKLAAEAQVKTMQLMPPPIPFDPPKSKKKNRKEGGRSSQEEDKDSTKYITFDCCLDPKDKNSEKVSRKLKVFEDGTPEEYCKWRIDYDDLVSYPAFKTGEAKLSLLLSILKGKSRDRSVTSHDNHKSENDAAAAENRLSANKLLECALNDMARDVFKVPNAARRQKDYMRNCLFLNDTVREWGKRLMELNKYFPYFPIENHNDGFTTHEGLPDDELNDILDRAKPISWHTMTVSLLMRDSLMTN
jgi:hypothetical protein